MFLHIQYARKLFWMHNEIKMSTIFIWKKSLFGNSSWKMLISTKIFLTCTKAFLIQDQSTEVKNTCHNLVKHLLFIHCIQKIRGDVIYSRLVLYIEKMSYFGFTLYTLSTNFGMCKNTPLFAVSTVFFTVPPIIRLAITFTPQIYLSFGGS